MGKLDELKAKAKDVVTDNRDKIEHGLEKAGDLVDRKTGGKHSDKIDKGVAKAQAGLNKVAGESVAGEGTEADGHAPQSAAPPNPVSPHPTTEAPNTGRADSAPEG